MPTLSHRERVICATCGRENPNQLVFCQECGQRLAPRAAAPAPNAAPAASAPATNPLAQTAMADNGPASQRAARPAAPSFDFAPRNSPAPPPAPSAVARTACSRCGAWNEAGIRFCVTCGNALSVSARPAASGSAAAIAPARVIAVTPPSPEPEPRVCARCRGANDPNAQFCRFCGAGLAATNTAPVPDGRADGPLTDPAPPLDGTSGRGPHHDERAAIAPVIPAPPAAPQVANQEPTNETSHLHGGYATAPVTDFAPRARLVVISKDGGEGPSYPVTESLDVGRGEGGVVIAEDRYLSARHARIVRKPERGGSAAPSVGARTRLWLRDLGSTNGVYIRLRPAPARSHQGPSDSNATPSLAHPLRDQDLFLVGQQVLRFEVVNDADEGLGPASQHGTLLFGSPATPRYARLCQRTVEGVTRDVFYIRKAETVLGRESGDIVFTEDPFLSRRHASLRVEKDPRRFLLSDLGSSNGTFVQIRGEVALENGDQFRVGQQLFRIDIG